MATTTFWARLVWGNRYLRLDQEPYILTPNFNPPSISRNVNFSRGKRTKDEYIDKAWSFELRIFGGNEEEVRGYISQLTAFVELAGDNTNKLYLEYYPHAAIGAIPLWGQGVYRYQIKSGFCSITSPWNVRDALAFIQVDCVIAPYAEGKRQRLANASGMTMPDNGFDSERGVVSGISSTNLVLNPIFNNSTWNTTWDVGGSATITKNTEPEFVKFGDTSAKLANTTLGAGTVLVYCNIGTVPSNGTYCISAYVKKPDGSSFGTAEIQLDCNGTALGAFNSISVGDGWYRIYDHCVSGTAVAAVKPGINVYLPGRSLYLDGFQMEYCAGGTVQTPSPMMYGGALGVTWAGTAGNSTSTAVPGQMKLAYDIDTFNRSAGCVRMAVRWNTTHDYPGTQYFYYAGTAASMSNRAYYQSSDKKIYFYAGGTYVASGTQSITANDIDIFHFVWGDTDNESARKVDLYINGVESAYNGNFSSIDAAGYIYIGCNNSGTSQLQANILDFTIFDQYIGSANVYADYQQVYEWVTGGDGLGRQLNSIPYLSTLDGDNVVDNYYDTTHQDWAVAANIPGNIRSHTVFDVNLSLNKAGDSGLLLANHTYYDTIFKSYEWSGVDYAGSVGTAAVSFPGTFLGLTNYLPAYSGRKMYIAAVITDSGTVDPSARSVITQLTNTNAFYSEWSSLNTTATEKEWYLIGPQIIPDTMPTDYDWLQNYRTLTFGFQLKRPSVSVSNGTATMDFYRLVVGDSIQYIALEGMGTVTTQGLVIDGTDAYSYYSSMENGLRTVYGDPIHLEPGKYNYLTTLPLRISRDYSASDYVTFNRVYVTPRFALL